MKIVNIHAKLLFGLHNKSPSPDGFLSDLSIFASTVIAHP